jgi:hypothetical protein
MAYSALFNNVFEALNLLLIIFYTYANSATMQAMTSAETKHIQQANLSLCQSTKHESPASLFHLSMARCQTVSLL